MIRANGGWEFVNFVICAVEEACADQIGRDVLELLLGYLGGCLKQSLVLLLGFDEGLLEEVRIWIS